MTNYDIHRLITLVDCSLYSIALCRCLPSSAKAVQSNPSLFFWVFKIQTCISGVNIISTCINVCNTSCQFIVCRKIKTGKKIVVGYQESG
jgi:hypothetical protein